MDVTVVKSKLDNLANAIGIKAKKRVPQTIDELIETVESIKTDPKLQEKSIDPKVQKQIITPDNGYDGLSSVTINKAKLQTKDAQPSNQVQRVSSDDGYLGLKDVFVQAMNLTSATVTPQPNENILTASNMGYDGFSSVTIQPIPDSYVYPTGCLAVDQQGYYDVSKYQYANVISNLVNKRIAPTDSPQLVSVFPTSNCGLYDKYYKGGVIYYSFPLDINKVYMSTMHITLTVTNNNAVEINAIQPVVYTRENMGARLYISTKPTILISQSGTAISCYYVGDSRNVKNITVDYLNVIECADSEKIYNLYLDRDNDKESKLYDVDFSLLNDNDTIYIFGCFGNSPFQYYIKWDSNKDLSFEPPSDYSSNNFKILPSQGKINISRMSDTIVCFSIAKCNQQYDGLSSVFVDAIPADYIGSDITVDPIPTITGATVNIPTGYYSTDTAKTIESVNHANPSMSIDSSTGIITASHTQGSGYVTGGTTQATLELSTQNATTITPSATSQTAVAAGKYTLGNVVVNAVPTESKTVTENGDVVPSAGRFLSKVTVNVQPVNQNKSVTPSENEQSITFDSGYTGLGTVTVGAISSTYIGSDIIQDPSPTVSGAVVNIPSGYYSESVSKSVATATQATPSVSINTANGLITATATQTAGYVASGSKSGTLQLTTKAATTITPTESTQTAVNKNVYTLGAIKVGAISSTYVGSAITTDPTPTASGATVTIPAGYYSTSTSKSVATTTHPKPSASIDATTGIVTASHSQTAGYVTAGTTTGTLQLTTKDGTSIDPTEEAQTAINAGTYALGNIIINAIPSTYVGSDITQDPTPTVSGATVNIPAGYYSTATSKSVSSTTQATPSISIDSTTGVVTATATQSAGYISAGSKSNTLSLDTIEAVTISPTEEEQIAAAKGVYTLGAIKVGAISSTYVGSGITRRDSSDLTDNGGNIYVPSGYYDKSASKSVKSMTLPSSESANRSGVIKATVNRYSSDVYINIPSGYNNEAACYVISGVPDGSATAPASISGTAATVSTGTNTLTLTKTVSVTPTVTAGYISSGKAGDSSISLTANVTVDPTPTASGATVTIPSGYYTTQITKSVSTGTASAPSSISGTSATVSTGTNTLTLTKTVSVTPTVSAGYVSSGTATNSSVSLTASVTTKAAATYHPSTTAQTIAASQYLTGAQTIAAVTTSNLSASNIVSGVTIKVGDSSDDDCVASVTGSVVLQNYYTGSSAPASSLGQNGDIYIQQ